MRVVLCTSVRKLFRGRRVLALSGCTKALLNIDVRYMRQILTEGNSSVHLQSMKGLPCTSTEDFSLCFQTSQVFTKYLSHAKCYIFANDISIPSFKNSSLYNQYQWLSPRYYDRNKFYLRGIICVVYMTWCILKCFIVN